MGNVGDTFKPPVRDRLPIVSTVVSLFPLITLQSHNYFDILLYKMRHVAFLFFFFNLETPQPPTHHLIMHYVYCRLHGLPDN